MNELKHYGLVISETPDPNAYVLGGITSLPKIVLQENGDWTDYLPDYEPQFGSNWDTAGCTVWGTQNIAEILVRKLTGKKPNYSERFNYILAGIRPPGADPHKVAECIRKDGLIDQEVLPMTETYEEFIQPDPMTGSLLALGQRFPYELKHEYIWQGSLPREERTGKIRECLRYSPLGVAVTAWFKEGDVYVDKGQPNTHWCVIFGEASNGWKVFDSYNQTIKILSFDHNITLAKRYSLSLKPQTTNWLTDLISRLNLIRIIKEILNEHNRSIAVPTKKTA